MTLMMERGDPIEATQHMTTDSDQPNTPSQQTTGPIVIDARMVDVTKLHGIARYALELVRHINAATLDAPNKSASSYEVLVAPEHFQGIADEIGELADTVKLIICDIPWLSIGELWQLRGVLKEQGAALFHSTSFVRPLLSPCPIINTLHDLNHVDLADNYSWQKRFYYEFLVKPLVAKADEILTVSEFSKARLVDWLDISPDRVVVTYNGIADDFFAEGLDEPSPTSEPTASSGPAEDQIRALYQLPVGKFWLGVAHDKAHKNSLTTIRAYRLADTELPLVLLGERHRLGEREQRSLGDLPGHKQVIFTGHVADSHLPSVYRLASVFLFPSYYEGFGLPPLEALAAGTPSVVADIPVFQETLDQRAVFASPHDPEAFGKAAVTLCQDDLLRQRLLANRLDFLRTYSWQQLAASTLNQYQRCLSR